jgi:hypothetical protein
MEKRDRKQPTHHAKKGGTSLRKDCPVTVDSRVRALGEPRPYSHQNKVC